MRILDSLTPALEDGNRVLIMDVVVPPPGAMPITVERDIRWLDLAMVGLFNAGDRSAEQWEALFQKAGPRLKYQGIKAVQGSNMSFIEAMWQT